MIYNFNELNIIFSKIILYNFDFNIINFDYIFMYLKINNNYRYNILINKHI